MPSPSLQQEPSEVTVLFRGFKPPHSRGWWKRRAERMVELCQARGELNILFTNDRTIRRLNRTYRNKDRATDVLAFEARASGPGDERLIGDVAISGEQAGKNALRYRHSIEAELLKLMAHGLLHLLGYEHGTGGEKMGKAEQMLLENVTPGPLVRMRKM